MNKQELASKLWNSADKMRGKIEASDYKNYILGFIFYKFLSEKEVNHLKKEGWEDQDLIELTEDNTEVVEDIQTTLGYFISYDNLFQTWISKKNDFTYSDVTDALSAFSRLINHTHRKVFDGIFDSLQLALPKLGTTNTERSKGVRDIIHLIDEIPMDDEEDYDVLGFIYEYLLSKFAENAGKKAGEFFSPSFVSKIVSNVVAHHLKDKEKVTIYDPTSGSGSLLLNIGKSLEKYLKSKDDIKYYAQELKMDSFNMTRMNLVMKGILPDNIVVRNADTLKEDWPYFEEGDFAGTYEPLFLEGICSNPPFSMSWYPEDSALTDPRFKDYGVAPSSKADYAFLLHCLYHLKPDGIMGIILPHGVLFRGNEEGKIRKNLIENNNIDTIVGLPGSLFMSTDIPSAIIFLRKEREDSDILFIDASQEYEKQKNSNVLRARDIRKITETVINRREIENYSRRVSREEIIQNDYNLNIPRYVSATPKTDNWDLFASIFGGIPKTDLDSKFGEYWDTLPGLFDALFNPINDDYFTLKKDALTDAIHEHESVKAFTASFNDHLANFKDKLSGELMNNYQTAYPEAEKEKLTDLLYQCFEDVPLVDQYDLFQKFHDQWQIIEQDIEIITSEGFEATKKVVPHMEVEKDKEIQKGWEGRVMPFTLIQENLLGNAFKALETTEKRLAEIQAEYKDIIDSLDEDEQEQPYLNKAKTAFVKGEVNKALKGDNPAPFLKRVKVLQTEETKLNKTCKDQIADMTILTKETIENLTDDQALELLEKKWIDPLINNFADTIPSLVSELVSGIQKLSDKYGDSLQEIEDEITETANAMSDSIDNLTGNECDMAGLAELQKLLARV